MFVVKYSGAFGYIKPWTAVRDGETYSQQFLTPSIIEGIEKKLFPELLKEHYINKIVRHKLSRKNISVQQEQVQTRGWGKNKLREKSILKRGVMINPELLLAFENIEDAQIASVQSICLCRNEDILMPVEFQNIDDCSYESKTGQSKFVMEMSEEEFSNMGGFELRFNKTFDKLDNKCFLVGYNRLENNRPMYGWLEINGEAAL